jgi:ubiquinone biosynthesis accessory factor UbiJ
VFDGAILEQLLNRHVTESTVASELLATLQGKRLAVTVDGLALRIVVGAEEGRLTVTRDGVPADAELRGAPIALARLLGTGALRDLKSGGAVLTGDLDVAERFAALFREARPDPEGELARWIGDIAAHELGAAVRGLSGWISRAGRALEADLAEYLQEESDYLPPPVRIDAFCAEVERLRDDVERAEQRLDRIARRMAADS